MRTLTNPRDRQQIVDRLQRLAHDARPRWGTMDPRTAVAHLADAMRLGYGELTMGEFTPSFVSSWLGRWLVIDSPLRVPRGVKAPPAFFTSQPEGFERTGGAAGPDRTDGRAARALGHQRRLRSARRAPMDAAELDHHLRQFGV